MKTIFDHIEHVKGKPHHIRKRVAFGVAGGVSTLIALVWFVGSLAMGTFAIQGTSFADSGTGDNTLTTSTPTPNQGLAGAAAAISQAKEPARIEIIDAASSTSKQKAEPTVIPF